MKKAAKKFLVSLNDSDRLILDSYCSLSSCLGNYLGSAYEVVVHSFGEGDRFILRITNGGLSGRTIDSKMTDNVHIVVEQLQVRIKHGDPAISVSFGINTSGRRTKSASIAILGTENKLIGMLCINCYLDTPFYEVIRNFSLPSYLESTAVPLPLNDSSRYDSAITSQILKVKNDVMNDANIPAKFKRKEIVRRLNDSGIFKVKNAIQICADTLDITLATIYMHLRNLEGPEN